MIPMILCSLQNSTAWSSQPFSMGSYTSIGVGGQQNQIEKVAEPLFQRPQKRTVSLHHIKYEPTQ